MKGKIYFAAGAAVGLLTGSRLGRGLYDRTAKAVGSVAGNSTVRQGVSSAGDRAVEAAKSAGGGLGHKVTELRRHVTDRHSDGEDAADAADAAGDRAGGSADGTFERAASGALNGTVGSPGPIIY